jgi:hypothetical protein
MGRPSVEALLEQRIDGPVVVGTTTESAAIRTASAAVPVVLAGTLDPQLPGVDVVVNDEPRVRGRAPSISLRSDTSASRISRAPARSGACGGRHEGG